MEVLILPHTVAGNTVSASAAPVKSSHRAAKAAALDLNKDSAAPTAATPTAPALNK